MKKLKKFLFLIILALPLFLGGCGEVSIEKHSFASPTPENCWPCDMYMQAFKALDTLLDVSLDKIAQSSLIVLEICLLFWFLFKVMGLVFSVSMPDMKKQLVPILTVLFKTLIVVLFLTNTTYFYDIFGDVLIQPLGDGFLSLADLILAAPKSVDIDNFTYVPDMDYSKFLEELMSGIEKIMGTQTTTGSKMFGGLAPKINEIIFSIYSALWNGVGLAWELLKVGDWAAFVSGFLLGVGMLWLMLMVPLFFVDALFRIGLILLLMPLFMVGWIFSFPKDIVKKVVHSLFSGFFDILFNCIYIVFLVSLFRVYENQRIPYLFSRALQIMEAKQRNEATEFGTNFIILLILTFTMLMLSSHVQEFSNHFFEGSEKSKMTDIMKQFKNLTLKGLKYTASLGYSMFQGIKTMISK